MTTTVDTQGIDHERLEDLEAEIAEVEAMLGQSAIELERAKWNRDRSQKLYNRARGMRERLLAGKDAGA